MAATKFEKVLVGSKAVEEARPGLLGRRPQDTDFLSRVKPIQIPQGEDYLATPLLLETYEFKTPVATLEEILALKLSHAFWYQNNASWYKHLEDIHRLRLAGIRPEEDLYEAAYKQWEESYGKKKVNLSQDKEAFFGQGVKRKYVHDSVHASVAFGERPLFEKLLAPGEAVKVSREAFEALTEEEKVHLAQEEVFVLALERQLIPRFEVACDEQGLPPGGLGTPSRSDLVRAYREELCLLITEKSKGWWPRWLVEHYFDFARPKVNYWELFQNSPKKELMPQGASARGLRRN